MTVVVLILGILLGVVAYSFLMFLGGFMFLAGAITRFESQVVTVIRKKEKGGSNEESFN